jgi:hypothetical protein
MPRQPEPFRSSVSVSVSVRVSFDDIRTHLNAAQTMAFMAGVAQVIDAQRTQEASATGSTIVASR